MKIYTYYEDIKFLRQDDLINLWKISWLKNGFEPIVLGREDAESHPFYSTFVKKLNEINKTMLGCNMKPYCLSCFLRWLAYASQKEESFYVSDYDVINTGVSLNEISQPVTNRVHFMDGNCPCFASGNPAVFELLCKDFIEVFEKYHNELLIVTEKNEERKSWHDQHFLVNFNKIMRSFARYKITRDRNIIGMCVDINTLNIKRIVHISHKCTTQILNKHPELQERVVRDARVEIVKKLLNVK